MLGAFVNLQLSPPPEAILAGFHKTYLCVGLLTAFATTIFLQLPRDEPRGDAISANKVREEEEL